MGPFDTLLAGLKNTPGNLLEETPACAKVSPAPFMGRQDAGKKRAPDGRWVVMQSDHSDTEHLL